METYITILRGINVSGQKLLKMEALRKIFTDLKFENVRTYIQSGNVIYTSQTTNINFLNEQISKAIENTFGFHVPIITLTRNELKTAIRLNPFLKDETFEHSYFHITFLANTPTSESIETIKKLNFNEDKIEINGKVIYLYCPDGYGNSKLTNAFLEKKLNTIATTRNWKTTNELLKIAYL